MEQYKNIGTNKGEEDSKRVMNKGKAKLSQENS